ncbi:hypothetical protein CCHL11_01208 [Colletotrichum chlorophyti]|uniref:Pentatricopeptide repeat domain-containing protein n=1 Tax=Colletotrichum chlorophyti TaxID=708187 RepID=A0A1Q8S801_9PEZI|nr:hypothetical protein CCHL11_01208 [Colletotrichum chlorophyti]
MEQRKALYDVISDEAESLWNIILEAVLDDEAQLQRALVYAEWLYRVHSAQWPNLYTKTVSRFLRIGQYRRAVQWHLRLAPNFDPGRDAFGSLLREFVQTSETAMHRTLQALYVTSLHRSFYNELIPLLYERGLSQICVEWRNVFIQHHDLPQPTAESQPYLKFLVRYYPSTTLELEEQMVVSLNSPTYWDVNDDSLWDAMKSTHSDENGSPGKPQNDALAARWFASSWIPLDFAIHAAHALGIRQIGPLSLQSIALREPTAKGVTARIEQLRRVNISIGYSAYSRVLKRFAEDEDNEMLSELLHTDIHPDVFDDAAMLASIRDKAVSTEAWKTHRLLLAIQPAIAEESVDVTSNHLLQQLLKQNHVERALALVDDMRTMDIDLSPISVHYICSEILDPLPWNPETTSANQNHLQMAITFLTRLGLLRKPVYSRYWQKIFFALGKFGRIGELEELCIGVLESYQKSCSAEGGLMPVHHLDAPSSNAEFLAATVVLIPADLPMTHDHHPMRRIFDNPALHAAFVRWGFKAALSANPDRWTHVPTDTAATSEFSVARGVRFLTVLQGRGLPFRKAAVQNEVIKCLARSYLTSKVSKVRLPTLEVARELFNTAAGFELLPPIGRLRDLMARTRRR